MAAKAKGKISYALQAINIIPLLFFGIVILILGSHWFSRSMHSEVETELFNVSCNLVTMFDTLYPGDYHLVDEGSYQLYKGSCNLTNDFALIDRIKEDTGLEITLFYQDTRILTTITGNNGARIVGSGAPETVIKNVLETGEARFYDKTLIYNSSYFSYYAPLTNSDGTVAGMLFVGKPTAEVDAAIRRSIYPLMIADIVLVVVVSAFTFLYTRKFASSLLEIRSFLGEISAGNLNATLSPAVLHRNDELGEIAYSTINMQRSLHTLVEQDALTSLFNRRSGDMQLRQAMQVSADSGKKFCVAIGDIDLFKRVNDTYGHECGDLVLKNVADILRRHMHGAGAAARWGGEEFLLIFRDMNLKDAGELLDRILEDIRSMETEYNNHIIKITMTFGLTEGNTEDVTGMLRTADEKLYEGKSMGRNRIIM